MSEIIGDSPCPSCRSIGKDSTGNHLIHFKNGGKFCNRCGYKVAPDGTVLDLGNLDEDDMEIIIQQPTKQKPTDTTQLDPSTLPAYPFQGLKETTLIKYNVRTLVNPDTEEVLKVYYPVYNHAKQLITWKCKELAEKKFYTLDKLGKKPQILMFGQVDAPKYIPILVITEGENDAMAAYQMLVDKVGRNRLTVLSVPNGANMQTVLQHMKLIQAAGQVYTCFDQDKPGQKLTEEFWKVFPTCLVMSFSEKDAHDMLKEGKIKEFIDAYRTAEPYKPRFISTITKDIASIVSEPIPVGLTTPWESLDRLIYGLRTHELIAIGAAPGVGKTTFVHQIQTNLMIQHREPIGVFSMEEPPDMLYRKVIGRIINEPIDIPGYEVSPETKKRIIKVSNLIKDKLILYDHYFFNGRWEEIESAIRFMAANGVKYFFIDPLSALVSSMDPSAQNQWLSDALYQMSKMVQVMDISIIHVNHLNDTKGNHETGGEVYASQFTGSRAQWRFSTSILGLSRNLHAETEEEKNTTIVKLLKARVGGHKVGGKFQLIYDKTKGEMNEQQIIF